jgi:hypothetical protein
VIGGLGAQGIANAQATPPVLKQTATVEKCDPTKEICIGNASHMHKELAYFTLKDEQQFVINRKFPFRRTRFIDVKDDLFGAFEKPDMLLVNGDLSPMSVETFEIYDSECESAKWSECLKIRDFPLAFGIHDLENEPTEPNGTWTRTAHAFLYIPMRFNTNGLAGLGDHFFLLVLHIPGTEDECPKDKGSLVREHCKLTVRLNAAWHRHKYSQRRMRYLIASEYRRFLDHVLDESFGSFVPAAFNARVAPLEGDLSAMKIEFSLEFLMKLGIFLHNDILHGTLK